MLRNPRFRFTIGEIMAAVAIVATELVAYRACVRQVRGDHDLAIAAELVMHSGVALVVFIVWNMHRSCRPVLRRDDRGEVFDCGKSNN